MRCRMRTVTPPRVRPRCRSRSSWPLKVSLTDSMICRNGLNSCASGPLGLALAGRSQQCIPLFGELGLEVAAVVVLVADHVLPGRGGEVGRGEDAQQGLRARRPWPRPARRRPAGREGCRPGAAAVPRSSASGLRSTRTGPSGQVRAFDGLAGAAALNGRGVHHPHVVAPRRGVAGQRRLSGGSVPRPCAAACCSRLLRAGTGKGGAGGRRHAAASGPRR